jgi:hypothetical protein
VCAKRIAGDPYIRTVVMSLLLNFKLGSLVVVTRGGAVGSGTVLQAGRSWVRFLMVSLDFFIDVILPAALWPWGRLNLSQYREYQKFFLGVKAAGA